MVQVSRWSGGWLPGHGQVRLLHLSRFWWWYLWWQEVLLWSQSVVFYLYLCSFFFFFFSSLFFLFFLFCCICVAFYDFISDDDVGLNVLRFQADILATNFNCACYFIHCCLGYFFVSVVFLSFIFLCNWPCFSVDQISWHCMFVVTCNFSDRRQELLIPQWHPI